MQFKDVVGQQKIKSQLVNMIAKNRLSHALLFLGKEGSGALALALAFAQYIVCQNAGSFQDIDTNASLFGEALPSRETAVDSCGECHACINSNDFVHPDIHFTFPVVPKKSGDIPISNDYIKEWRTFLKENLYGNAYEWLQYIGAEKKQGNITALECNTIIKNLNLKSVENGYKIQIIWMPEYLTKEGNKLLKLIEEPPAKTIFLFVAEDTEKILPTILSRCQLIKIPMLEVEDMTHALEKQFHLESNVAQSFALQSQGNFHDALKLAKADSGPDWNQSIRDWLNVAVYGNPVSLGKWLDEYSKLGREDLKQLLRYFTYLLEQSMRLSSIGNEVLHLPEADFNFATTLNKISTIPQQQAIIGLLDEAAYHIERNAHSKMLLHALSIQLLHIIKENAVFLTE